MIVPNLKMNKYAAENNFHTYLEHWSNSRASSKHAKCSNLAGLILEAALVAVSLCKQLLDLEKKEATF
jgi:hypothetical protein